MCPQDIMFPVCMHDSSIPKLISYHSIHCSCSAPKHHILVCVHNGSAPSILFLPAYTAAVVPASYYWLWPQWQFAQTYFMLLKILQLMCPQETSSCLLAWQQCTQVPYSWLCIQSQCPQALYHWLCTVFPSLFLVTHHILALPTQWQCPQALQYQFCTTRQCEFPLPKGALTHATIGRRESH